MDEEYLRKVLYKRDKPASRIRWLAIILYTLHAEYFAVAWVAARKIYPNWDRSIVTSSLICKLFDYSQKNSHIYAEEDSVE